MSFDPLEAPPLLTADLPGIGGRIKQTPEDFEVEEIPAYEPSGSGDFLYLWMQKRDMGAEYFVRQVAQRLGIAFGEVGTAGLKDRHAVTRQMVSVPARAVNRLNDLAGNGIEVLKVGHHGNKLRPGHLRGNRFHVLIRGAEPRAAELLVPILDRLRRLGFPNFYGGQRFGREGETVLLGLALLKGDEPPFSRDGRKPNLRNPFLKKLAMSAAQAALFNVYLCRRTKDGLLRTVLFGDVMCKLPVGGMFLVEEVAREQERFDNREIVHSGPIFGKKTFPAAGSAADREGAVLQDAGLTLASFKGFGRLAQGTRRHNLAYVADINATVESEGTRLRFTLPPGSYATVLLQEIMKKTIPGDDEES